MRGAGLATSDPICKCWVVNFKCNVYENQAEPCILLRIYFFFLTCEMLEGSPSIHFSTAWRQNSAIISFRWEVPSLCPPLSPGPLKYSDFVGFSKPVVFTYKVVFFFLYIETSVFLV